MPARKSEETPEQPTIDEFGIESADDGPQTDVRRRRSGPKTEGGPRAEDLADDRPQVIRERDRMRAVYEERGVKS